MRKLLIAGATLVMIAGQANAEMPHYNVKDYCRQVADISGGSQVIYQGCFKQEQSSYDKLKPAWEGLPAKMRRHCDEVSQVTGGSYVILEGCIRQETSAANASKDLEFKR